MKYLWIIFLAAFPVSSFAEETIRDPFMPFVWDKPASVSENASKESYDITPLTKKPLSSYRLVGLIVAPNDAIALIKARDKREYFATIGDAIGSEGGIIDTIYSDGITIDMNGKIIDLTVSNRFDIQNEIE